ncbi:3-hydroxyacyl-CoA dehydrogenase-like protein [Lindgomyces ingoldianus]|uniref:3-hydroxyacyl-CoA dehydrogenase-like protein n=1 Tax=Lindgomyces ingoldianus TaxID=673940 RepID=A0ACB6QE53_9PLEO|nr:3-hydroxyacyl-CoA dehydrogenase-like protein [Lindgomyces ingoldianus]KAF2464421.1 3-hydroxyacyl-CoA dehydrogenase-like protein [Lindgomyces ingoldianus]
MSSNPWHEPQNYKTRPVAIIGAGVLGRRIATAWAAAGYAVHMHDPDAQAQREALKYFTENVAIYQQGRAIVAGELLFSELEDAVAEAWHVVECVPEVLEVKQKIFGQLERLAARDSILATNSSSFRSKAVSEKMGEARQRVLNTHYFMPPYVRAVELMTNGSTALDIFPFLAKRLEEVGAKVFVAKKESTGFIHNRVWAAMKRELLMVVAEGVSDPATVDDIFFETVVVPGLRPFRAMDVVGLDTVAIIEENFAKERGLETKNTVDFLKREYVDKGRLGSKSDKGGFFPPEAKAKGTGAEPSTLVEPNILGETSTVMEPNTPVEPRILVLDNGLSGEVNSLKTGKVLEYSTTGQYIRTLFKEQYLPDGIAVSRSQGRFFWTCMGYPGTMDGTIWSAKIDGSDHKQLIEAGILNTPKQITLDPRTEKLYVADREGLGIWRCDLGGGNLEQIICTGDKSNENDRKDATRWCVGIALSHRLGKIFWTQKGLAKGWQGRIFSAGIDVPQGESANNRTDKVCLLEGLAEPVDLDFYEEGLSLYWTDRGEMPFGNTLNRLQLNGTGSPLGLNSTPLLKYQILVRNFHEAIGLTIDAVNKHVYVADLGGTLYRCNLDGSEKTRLCFDESRGFTGISLT